MGEKNRAHVPLNDNTCWETSRMYGNQSKNIRILFFWHSQLLYFYFNFFFRTIWLDARILVLTYTTSVFTFTHVNFASFLTRYLSLILRRFKKLKITTFQMCKVDKLWRKWLNFRDLDPVPRALWSISYFTVYVLFTLKHHTWLEKNWPSKFSSRSLKSLFFYEQQRTTTDWYQSRQGTRVLRWPTK